MSAQDPPAFTLVLHGAPRLRLPDQGVRALERRAAGLCTLVALEPGVSRGRAAGLLWPGSDDPRRALRQQLARFRALFGVALVEGDERLQLGAAVGAEFGPAGEHAADPPFAELLEGQAFDDCPAFAAWLEARRGERLRAWVQAARERQAAAEAEGRHADALQAARDWRRADPLQPRAWLACLRAHYLMGDRAGFDESWAAFEDGLGALAHRYAPVFDEARALRESMHRASAPWPAAGPGVPAVLLRPPHLAGRQQAWRALAQAWAEGRAVLLQGEAGMGKSRLIDEFAAATPGVVAARGRPGDAGVPYATLARVLRAVHALPEAAGQPRRSELALVLPELAPAQAHRPQAGEAAPQALRQAVQGLLATPSLAGVIVDDLHFADAASCEMLRTLSEPDALPGLRWLFAQRGADATAAGQALLDGLIELRRLERVDLQPLDVPAMHELIRSLGLPALDASALAEPLARHSGGNPLFALETLKHGLAEGALLDGRLPRPGGVRTLIERRLQQLPERALALARVAAVAGVDFTVELAESVMGLRTIELADAMQQLQQAQVLRDEAFAHDLVHDAVRQGVPQAIARRLHDQCARFLDSRGGEPARVAAHWEAAERFDAAVDALRRAAARAAAAARHSEQATFLERAAAACERGTRSAERFELLVEHVAALVRGHLGAAALQVAAGLEALATTPGQRLAALRVHADALGNHGQAAAAVERARQGIVLARELCQPLEELRLAAVLVPCLAQLQRLPEAAEALGQMQAAQARIGGDESLQLLVQARGTLAFMSGRMHEAVAFFEEDLRLCERLGLHGNLPATLNNLALCHARLGRLDPACACGQRALELYRQDPGHAGRVHQPQINLARFERERGRFDRAIAGFEAGLAGAVRARMRLWQVLAETGLGATWLRLGQLARAAPLLSAPDADMPPFVRGQRRVALALLHHADGQRASELVAEARALLEPARVHLVASAPQWLALVDAAEALELAGSYLAECASSETPGLLLSLHARAAEAATVLGRGDLALAHLGPVLQSLDAGIAPEGLYLPEVHLVASGAWLAAGDAAAATRALHAGLEWVRLTALPHVPPGCTESFLVRNPVNRRLLALEARLAAHGSAG